MKLRQLLALAVVFGLVANLGNAIAFFQVRAGGQVGAVIVNGTLDRAAAFNGDSDGNLYSNVARNSSPGRSVMVAADTSRSFAISTAGATSVVTGGTSTAIYVTGWGGTIGTTAATGQTVQVVYGTGTTCLTSQVVLTGAYTGGTATTSVMPTVISEGGGFGVIFTVPANNNLCLVTTGAQAVAGRMSYAQF